MPAAGLSQWARRSACFVVAGCCLGLSVVQAAQAQLGEAALSFGHELSRVGELDESSHELTLNGEALRVASQTVDASLDEVQTQLRGECRGSVGPILSRRTPRRVMIACLVSPGGDPGDSILPRLLRFSRTQDLAALGFIRYAYARRTGDELTHLVLVSTSGSFRLDRVLPPPGADAPGTDPPRVPRPADSRRVLSARLAGARPGLWVYASARPVDSALDDYHRQLSQAGWQPVAARVSDPDARGYVHDRDTLVVSGASATRGSSLTLAMSPGGPDF